jgi:heme/copper-type cytochrome/quinol oxidase subunit 4
MSIFLWILQGLLAIHTLMGAGWKLFNSEAAVPSLSAMPHWLWLALIPLEVICAAGLVLPAVAPALGYLVPLAALGVALEMGLFAVLHLNAGTGEASQLTYWIVVAAICLVIAGGRLWVAPL